MKRLFGNCRIIGKRFPIVHVFADGDCLEVSSFGTRANRELIPPDAAAFLPRNNPHDKVRANPRATQRQSCSDCGSSGGSAEAEAVELCIYPGVFVLKMHLQTLLAAIISIIVCPAWHAQHTQTFHNCPYWR